jgi:hypothetical protein
MCLVAEILREGFPLPDTNCDTRKPAMEPHVRYNLYRRNILCQSWSLSLSSEDARLLVEVPSPHTRGLTNRTVERSLVRAVVARA